ncbi:MAG: dTDP-4-dehydrorhamnose 3,5-epimerase family protein, partial [Clostridia bacterium]|nr:dTDP-4-dehydrorhamnose 3,5-epimerase family protein [Clostridia bacterium]
MNLTETGIKGVYLIEPAVFGDNRGWFYESYSALKFAQLGIDTVFVQDNRSFSEK